MPQTAQDLIPQEYREIAHESQLRLQQIRNSLLSQNYSNFLIAKLRASHSIRGRRSFFLLTLLLLISRCELIEGILK